MDRQRWQGSSDMVSSRERWSRGHERWAGGVSDGPWTVRGGRDRQTWSGNGPGAMRDGKEA
jgi:hypothetical protein